MAGITATALTLAAVASVVGTGAAVYGQQQAAKAAEYTADYNKRLQLGQAKQETAVAAENARRKARENARIIGAQRAALAEAGLAMEGTPLAVLGETAATLQRDILDLGYTAASRSRSLMAGANLSAWQGRSQASAMRTNAISTGISGAASGTSGFLSASGRIAPSSSTSTTG